MRLILRIMAGVAVLVGAALYAVWSFVDQSRIGSWFAHFSEVARSSSRGLFSVLRLCGACRGMAQTQKENLS